MTTLQDNPSIGTLLRRQRGDDSKASVYRRFGVSPQTYDAWEGGLYVPSDEYAVDLADYLGMRLEQVVMTLYRDRIREMSCLRVLGLTTYTPQLAA